MFRMTTRQYLRFTPSSVFGIIGSSSARILHLYDGKNSNSVVVPACEDVMLWNLQTKEKSMVLKGESSYVSCLMYDAAHKNIAVGYGDGMIRIFNVRSGDCIVSFCGHKSAVSCLTYDVGGLNLASGGKDSEIVVWNVSDQAGLFRLKGHKGPITQCYFFKQKNILISSSKDTYLKLWDLDTQHCVQTIVGSRSEILDFIVLNDSRLLVGINDSNLIVWDLFKDQNDVEPAENAKRPRLDTTVVDVDSNSKNAAEKDSQEDYDEKFKYHDVGKLLTLGDKTVCLVVDKTHRLLGCSANTKQLQLYKILSSEEVLKHLRKRKRKEEKKNKGEVKDTSMEAEFTPSLVDEFQPFTQPIQTSAKIDSFSIVLEGHIAKIAVLLKNNSIFHYQLDIKSTSNVAEICHSIVLPGHRSVVRSLNYSADSLSVLSASNESVKVWKKFREELVCTQTLNCDSALCSVLLSGSNYCVIGTKDGILEIFDINSQQLLEKVEAHDYAVNCICEHPNQLGITSGSKDKSIKFWDYELVQDESYSQTKKRLSLSLKRTLQMPDEIICLRYSPDKKKIAVSLLDNTVQVLFADSLKLVFSLYGHSLPVTCMDISYDGTLIATGSEDKDIRIWSMEFGSCNKFLKRAHDKGITCLNFLPKTHMFFTGGRDNAVKQWDADNFQKIITLKGHQNEVSAMAVSPDGVSVLTASRDKSMRIWEKTSEPLVLEEEQEKEREEEEQQELEDLPVVPGEVNKEVALPGIKTKETIKTADQLIDALHIYKEEVLKLEEYEVECKRTGKELPRPTPHPLLVAYSATSPLRYVQKVLNKVKSSELEGILLHLPFNYVLEFLKILCEFADRGWETELCERCSSFLVRIHLGQILSAQNFQPVIERLMEKLFSQVYHARDMVGFVKVACELQQRAIDAQEEVPMFTSVLEGLHQKKKKSRRKLERPIVAFS